MKVYNCDGILTPFLGEAFILLNGKEPKNYEHHNFYLNGDFIENGYIFFSYDNEKDKEIVRKYPFEIEFKEELITVVDFIDGDTQDVSDYEYRFESLTINGLVLTDEIKIKKLFGDTFELNYYEQ